MKNYGKAVLLRDKITACIEKSEFLMLQEAVKNCRTNQIAIEQKLAAVEKISFELLATIQRFTKDLNSLKLWRDHKIKKR